jgi:hypothetical protein
LAGADPGAFVEDTDEGAPPLADQLLAYEQQVLKYAEFHRKVSYNKGNMYKRMAEEENMPPTSAPGILVRDDFQLSDEDRASIADYLLGGAPR